MSSAYPIPLMGSVGALETIHMASNDAGSFLLTEFHAPYRRFAVRITDHGLDSFGLIPGAYAVFREQGWPTNECQICLLAFGDEATVRMMENIYSTEPTLRVSGDRIPPIEPHRNDFIVLGVLEGLIHEEFARIIAGEETFDWGC